MTDQSTPTQSAERVKKDSSNPTPTYPIWLNPEEADFLIGLLSELAPRLEEYNIDMGRYFLTDKHVTLSNSIVSKINVTKNTQKTQ